MNYIDTFHFLNPHLFIKKSIKHIRCTDIYTVERQPPVILRNHADIIESVTRLFGIVDTLFKTAHSIHYPRHIVNATRKDITGSFSVIHVNILWGYGYYHFLTEVLPSVLEINQPHPIYCQGSSFAIPVFRWFDIPNDVLFKKIPYVNVKYIYEQPYIECGVPSPQKINAIRAIVCKKLTFSRTKGILIYRKEAYRTIRNHEAVFTMLKKVFPHLEWVTFNSCSISDTATLFSQAALIVGPHGAGLTNMLFSDSGIRIIEFMPLNNPNLCYWHMSELLGHKYAMIPCETIATNFEIDIAAVERLLETH
jgi:hypothetical protein